jgi:pimeloyl-ACP methyl ester carboxylesterase
MTVYTHNTTPTQFVDANGIRFAYRRLGKPGTVPLVFNVHYTGTMDYWDPAVTDRLAQEREVILFDNAGVGASSGEVPNSFTGMAANAIAFIRAMSLEQVDVLGFSIGGMVAQEIAVQAPELARKLILVGTGPRGADMTASQSQAIFSASYDEPEDVWLKVHFTPSAASQAAGRTFIARKWLRQDRSPEMRAEAIAAQGEALGKHLALREVEGYLDYLRDIRQPTLVVQGSNDVIIPTHNSYVLQQTLPGAHLILYPDSNHGSFFQYPELFVEHAGLFLNN